MAIACESTNNVSSSRLCANGFFLSLFNGYNQKYTSRLISVPAKHQKGGKKWWSWGTLMTPTINLRRWSSNWTRESWERELVVVQSLTCIRRTYKRMVRGCVWKSRGAICRAAAGYTRTAPNASTMRAIVSYPLERTWIIFSNRIPFAARGFSGCERQWCIEKKANCDTLVLCRRCCDFRAFVEADLAFQWLIRASALISDISIYRYILAARVFYLDLFKCKRVHFTRLMLIQSRSLQ